MFTSWSPSMTFFFVWNLFIVRFAAIWKVRIGGTLYKLWTLDSFVWILFSDSNLGLMSMATTLKKEGLQNLFNLLYSN